MERADGERIVSSFPSVVATADAHTTTITTTNTAESGLILGGQLGLSEIDFSSSALHQHRQQQPSNKKSSAGAPSASHSFTLSTISSTISTSTTTRERKLALSADSDTETTNEPTNHRQPTIIHRQTDRHRRNTNKTDTDRSYNGRVQAMSPSVCVAETVAGWRRAPSPPFPPLPTISPTLSSHGSPCVIGKTARQRERERKRETGRLAQGAEQSRAPER